MIVVVKNKASDVENTVYITPKEKRGAANVAEYGATIAALGMEIKSLTTDKTVMVNAKSITVTDRFTTFVFDASTTAGDSKVDLSGASWPEGFIQYRVVERASVSDVEDITASDVILEKGLGYLTTEDGAYQETTFTSHVDETSTFTYYE